jgi:hypothetical protein
VTNNADSLKEDISFLRSLAEAGRRGPLVGAAWLVAAGAVFGTAPLVNWVFMVRGNATESVTSAIYGSATILFVAVGIAITIVFRDRIVAAADIANRTFAIAWQAAGYGSFIVSICAGILGWRAHSSIALWMTWAGSLCLYGGAWLVCWRITLRRWMFWAAVASYLVAVGSVLLPVGPYLLLVFSASIVSLALVPGLYLLFGEAH